MRREHFGPRSLPCDQAVLDDLVLDPAKPGLLLGMTCELLGVLVHVCMSTPNCTILEVGSGQDPFWQDLFYGGHFSYERGYANPPTRPGLGIDLDEKVAAKFPYQEKHWNTLRTPDGAYVDR